MKVFTHEDDVVTNTEVEDSCWEQIKIFPFLEMEAEKEIFN